MDKLLNSGEFLNEIFDHQNNSTSQRDQFDYFWYDEYHVTTPIHKRLADKILEELRNSVY